MHLPMFPLGNVVLPGELLPLNVFEPRYRQLVLDCLAADVPEFGVVLIERGSEVGGGDVRASIGTVTRIARVHAAGHRQVPDRRRRAAASERAGVVGRRSVPPRRRRNRGRRSTAIDDTALRQELDRLVGRVDEARRLAREVAGAQKPTLCPRRPRRR